MTNGLLLDLLTRPIMRPRPRPRNKGGLGVDRAMRAGALLWVVVFVGSLIYGQVRLGQFDSATQPGPKITVVQTHVPQSNKTQPKTDEEREAWRLAQEEDWAKLLGWTIAAAEQHPDLIAWPETVVPKPVNAEARAFEVEREISWGPTIYHETIADLAARKGVNLIVGAPAYVELDVDAEGYIHGRRSNAALFYDAQGVQAFERYDKIHRVPFGEYIPWVDSIPPLKNLFIRYLTPYSQDYTLVRGDSYTVFTARELSPPAEGQTPGTFSFVTPICYEDASPRVVRRMLYTGGGRKRADLIVNLTNSAWYAGDNQRLQHLQIATLRCIENRVPAARSVNTGISAFIDSAGRVTHAVEENGRMIEIDGIATDRVRLDTRTTFYGRLGNVPITLLALATGLLVLVALIRRGKMPGRHRLATRETR
jgi:apolipoprotein N-acyltransferase